MIKITVVYTCGMCDIVDAPVEVESRDSDGDLMDWMNAMAIALANDHHRRSPHCHPKKFKVVKIPVENTGWVGGPPIQ